MVRRGFGRRDGIEDIMQNPVSLPSSKVVVVVVVVVVRTPAVVLYQSLRRATRLKPNSLSSIFIHLVWSCPVLFCSPLFKQSPNTNAAEKETPGGQLAP